MHGPSLALVSMSKLRGVTRLLVISAITLLACPLSAALIVVPGTANIFGAGHAVPPSPGGGGGGVLPPSYSFAAGPDQVLEFSSVTGEVSPILPTWCGPDGLLAGLTGTDIQSYGGISGIVYQGHVHGMAFFLTGVFLDDNEPDPAFTPARLDFSYGADSFVSLAPETGQTFFIGDGLTGTGTGEVQQFIVPENATRLFLGFADAGFFVGLPGAYVDNSGALSAQFEIRSAVPEPTSCAVWLLLGAAVLGVKHLRYRRFSQPM